MSEKQINSLSQNGPPKIVLPDPSLPDPKLADPKLADPALAHPALSHSSLPDPSLQNVTPPLPVIRTPYSGQAGTNGVHAAPWSQTKKFGFRLLFVFMLAMCIPFSASWYKNVFTLNWLRPHYRDIYDIARFQPDFQQFFGDLNFAHPGFLADYTDWFIALLIGIAGASIWTILDRKSKSYHLLYYWIRVVVRYRAGIGIIGFGFTKLFPTQMPYPSLGLLNSNFGDFTAQKIYWLSVGIVPWYQVFAGVVEVTAGTLLFFRKTTTFGAILLAGALGDITFVNYAYDGGVHVYAFYFVFLALILLAEDLPKLYQLIILEKYTVPLHIYPDFNEPFFKYLRIGLKTLTFVIFFIILTYTEVINFKYDPYKQPSTAGIKKLRGNYLVSEFKLNGRKIPYNPLDTVRWQEATFENWTTLTFKVNHPVVIDPSNGGGSPMRDIQRTFEITGVAGGERAFHYLADTLDKVLYLQDKNIAASRSGRRLRQAGLRKPRQTDNWISKAALAHIGEEKTFIDRHAWSARRDREFAAPLYGPERNRMVLKYATTDGSHVILSGINEHKDSIYVVLDRYDKHYILSKSNLSGGTY